MLIKRVYFLHAIASLDSLTVISNGQPLKGQTVSIKYSDKMNAVIIFNTIIPMSSIREILFEEVETEIKPKEVKKTTTKEA
jgi:hypothetical protein